MKILLHVDGYSRSSGFPGVKRVHAIAQELLAKGHEVTILSNIRKAEALRSPENQLSNETIEKRQAVEKIAYCPTIPIGNKSNMRRLWNNLSFTVSSFFRALFMARQDIILTSSPPALISVATCLIAKLKRSKLIYDVRDIWPDIAVEMESFQEDSKTYKVFDWVRNYLNKNADLITTVSETKVRNIQKRLSPDVQEKVKLVSNGLDLRFLDSQEHEEIIKRFRLREKKSVVFMGNLGLAQGLENLLRLAEECEDPSIQFLLFGSGIEEEHLRQVVEEKRIENIIFGGRIPFDQVYTVYKYAHLAYVPLKDNTLVDSIPTKIYEALAVACPVLLLANTEGDAAKLLAEAKHGICVDPNDFEGSREAFYQLIQEYSKYKARQEEVGELIASEHSLQESARKMRAYMEALVR